MKPAFLFNNLGLKLSSLLVAGVLWAAAQGFQSVELSLDLPIAFSDTPETVVVVGQSVSEVNLRLKGSRAALRSVAEEFSIFPISLVGLEPGTREFVIDTESLPLPRGAEVVARSPSKVELRIEPVIRKRVVIRADIVGALPDGYQIQGIELTPHEVVLEGARGSLRRLREISTRTVDVSGLTETTSQQAPLVLEAGQVWRVGARGEPVEVKILIQAPDNGTEPE